MGTRTQGLCCLPGEPDGQAGYRGRGRGAGKGWRRSKAVLHTGTRRPRLQSYLTP